MMKQDQSSALIDALFKEQGKGPIKTYGSVAAKLLKAGMKVNSLRTNDTLRKDEWKHLDEKVVQISRQRLVAVNDLVSRGLVYNLTNGLGTTVLEYENISDEEDAVMNMDGVARGPKDRPEFDIGYLPLPITHKSFSLSIRVLNASRTRGESLDTTQAEIAARKVAEKIEYTLFNGASITFGGGTVYGYTNHPNRNTVTLSTNWDDYSSGAVGAGVLDNVIEMKQAAIDAKHYGPYMLYVPTNYETVLDKDYATTTSAPTTIRNRIKMVGGIEDVKVADFLTADNVVMVEMAPDTVRMVIGLQPTNVEWDTEGGMVFNFKVMAIMVPQIRADQDGNSGIVHLAA